MQSADREVIERLIRWLQQGFSPWLCTIVRTYGSAPRPAGSLFAFCDGQRAGSISGGCIEDEFVRQLIAGQFPHAVQFYLYGETQLQSPELPCGGRIRLCIEKLSQSALEWLLPLREHLERQAPCRRQLELASGRSEILSGAAPVAVQMDEKKLVVDCGSQWSLLLLGASPVAEEVAHLGIRCGYRVRVCDMREEFAGGWKFAELPVERELASLFVAEYSDARSAVLALAHDPRVDDIGLMQALTGPAFYIGAMGSARTSQNRRERLLRSGGISPAQLQRLHAPVGLPIGSKTPPEIAVAILADIIRARTDLAETAAMQESETCNTPQ